MTLEYPSSFAQWLALELKTGPRSKGENDKLTLGKKAARTKRTFYDVHGCLGKFEPKDLGQNVIMKIFRLVLRCMTTVSWSEYQHAATQEDGALFI